MAAFQFPDPTVQQTVVNPITGSTYQWKEPPGKWVVTVSVRKVEDIVYEGDNPPIPRGDYKLWYSTDTLELYFWYEDENGNGAWVPTSVPIQVLEDLNAFAAEAEIDIDQLQYKQQLLQNAVDQIYLDLMTGASARPPIFSDTEPTVHPDFTAPNNGLETGDTWFDNTDPEQLIEYVYDGTQWIVTGNYVKKKGGDTMEGQLIINGPRNAGDDVDNPDLVSSLKVLNIDNAQNSALQLRHSGNAKVYIGDTEVSIASDIKFNRSQPSIVKTNVQELLEISDQEIAYLGRSIEDEDLVNKKYVDDIESALQNGIIELEEEIDAIAPSVERGKWRFTAVGTVANPGQFTMYDAEFGSGNPTGLFKSAKSIWFNAVDSEGTTHAFGDVDDGELLEVFVDGAPEYGLYEVVGQAHDETLGATSFWVIDVNFVRTNEDTAAVAPGETCRFKVFMAPTGGDASSFVMKSGDQMTGQLELNTEQAGNTTDYNVPAAGTKHIRFVTKRLDTGSTYPVSLYQPGYGNYLMCSGSLMARDQLYTNKYIFATSYNSDGTRTTKNPRIYFNRDTSSGNVLSEYGALQWSNNDRVYWDNDKVEVSKTPLVLDGSLATADTHAIHKGYIDKVIRMSGLQLGMFEYRRSSDSFAAGTIKSNTTTNPANITELSIWKSSIDGIFHGADFYEYLIVPGMFLHFMDKNSANYVGKITAAEKLTNGIRVTLNPVAGDISGSVYLRNQYNVSISYNRFGFKFP